MFGVRNSKDDLLTETLAGFRMVEREVLASFDASKLDRIRTQMTREGRNWQNNGGYHDECGGPLLLIVILNCIRLRCGVLGL